MGFFSSGKTLSREKMERLLHEITSLNDHEREYVKAVIEKHGQSEISRNDAAKAMNELEHNFSDSLRPDEVKKVKEKIMGFFF